jgi:hypothetical protein
MMQNNGKTNDTGLTFSPAFRYSGISTFHRRKNAFIKIRVDFLFYFKLV